jgi:hypothetical protein
MKVGTIDTIILPLSLLSFMVLAFLSFYDIIIYY